LYTKQDHVLYLSSLIFTNSQVFTIIIFSQFFTVHLSSVMKLTSSFSFQRCWHKASQLW